MEGSGAPAADMLHAVMDLHALLELAERTADIRARRSGTMLGNALLGLEAALAKQVETVASNLPAYVAANAHAAGRLTAQQEATRPPTVGEAQDRLAVAACRLLAALDVKNVSDLAQALEVMAVEVARMSPSEPVLGRLKHTVLQAPPGASWTRPTR